MYAISSILFMVWYNSYIAIIVGRCLAGLAHGIVYNATITHAAENVVKEIRGMLLSTINCMIFSGVFVAAIFIASVTYGYSGAFNSDRILGIFGLSFSLIGILCTMFLTYESVPYLLRRNKDSEAVVNMLKLRNESVITTNITNDLDEMKLMVAEDKQYNQNIFNDCNGTAVSKMIALRILCNLTNNFIFNIIMMNLTATLIGRTQFQMAAVILTGTRYGASFISIFSSDFIKRKFHLTASGMISGLLVLVLAIVMVSLSDYRPTYWIPGVLCIAFQLTVSLGIDPMQHVFLSEAFSTSKKAWSIAFVTTAENLSQILLVGVYFISGITYETMISVLFVTAGLMLLLVLILQFTLPETFKMTMKETRDLFSK